MEVRGLLQEMGFSAGMIEASLKNTDGSMEQAVEWIEKKQQEVAENENEGNANEEEYVQEVRKPLTEEEKAAKLQALRDKADQRKAEQAKEDAKLNKRNEELRKKREKSHRDIIEDQQKKEALKEAAKRRQQIAEDAAAKRRVKELIEADKRARKAQREQQQQSNSSGAELPSSAEAPVAKAPSRPRQEPTESKIRFRLPNAPQPLTKSYPVETTVGQVLEDVASSCGTSANQVELKLTFPTRIVKHTDAGKTLKEADLINTNVMVVIT